LAGSSSPGSTADPRKGSLKGDPGQGSRPRLRGGRHKAGLASEGARPEKRGVLPAKASGEALRGGRVKVPGGRGKAL
jgi:hypothetical protein